MAAAAEERLVVALEARIRDFEKNMAKAKKSANDNFASIEKRAQTSATKLAATFKAVESSAVGLGAKLLALGGIGLGAREVIAFADSWTRANNSLKVAGLSGTELTTVMGQLFDAAQRQGAPIEALTTLYGRAAQSAKELGATRQDLVQFSEDVAVALRVAGTSPEQASGALLQLSQLLGSARVQAEEFNSVNEGARPILQAVANGIEEAGGSVSKLKALVTDGKISNVAFFKGFQAGAEGLREQAGSATETIAQGFTRVSNAITKTVGELDKTSGASANAVENMKSVATAIDAIPTAVNAAVDKLGDLQRWLTSVGNSPFWEKYGKLVGVNFTPEEAASHGITLGGQREQGLAALKAGQGSQLGGGFDVSDLASGGAKPAAKTIKAADYPVIGGKEKSGRETIDQYDREVEAISRRTEAMRLEATMVGRSTYETDKARAAQDLLNAAKRQYGENISPQVRQQIEAEAEAYGRAAESFDKAREKQQQVNQLQQEFGHVAIDGIEGLVDGTKTLNDVLSDTLKRLADMVLQGALLGEGPLGSMLGGGSLGGGGTGGILGPIIGAVTKGLFGFADGGVMTQNGPRRLKRYASGGISKSAAIFGEAGPEAAVPLPDGRRIPVDLKGGSNQQPPQVNVNAPLVKVHIHGAPPGTTTEQSEDPEGGQRLDVYMDRQIASAIGRPGSASQKAMRGGYGAAPRTARR